MIKLLISKRLRYTWLVVIMVLIIDLGSKFLILNNFDLGDTLPLLPLLNLYYTRNYGAAFSFLAEKTGWQRWFFVGVSFIVCIILVALIHQSKANKKQNNISCALIIGGALGNSFDRLWHGFVIDMIDFYIYDWHFATFNFADSAIFIGTMSIILNGFLQKFR